MNLTSSSLYPSTQHSVSLSGHSQQRLVDKGKNAYFKAYCSFRSKMRLNYLSANFILNSSVHQKTSWGNLVKMQISRRHLQTSESFPGHLLCYQTPWI